MLLSGWHQEKKILLLCRGSIKLLPTTQVNMWGVVFMCTTRGRSRCWMIVGAGFCKALCKTSLALSCRSFMIAATCDLNQSVKPPASGGSFSQPWNLMETAAVSCRVHLEQASSHTPSCFWGLLRSWCAITEVFFTASGMLFETLMCENRLLKKASITRQSKSVKLGKYWLDPSRFTSPPPVGHLT